MHLALHAAQNGPVDIKAMTDLARGLAILDSATWEEAARLAEELGAGEAFAAGLRLTAPGRLLADRLSLTDRMTVELALRTRSAPTEAIFFERLREAKGTGTKLVLLARKLYPTRATLQDHFPIARRGRFGRLCARIIHPFSVASRLPAAFFAWIEARRATNESGHDSR